MRGHVAIIIKTESTYIMIESTLQFDDVEDIPGLLPLLWAVQRSRMRSRERSGSSKVQSNLMFESVAIFLPEMVGLQGSSMRH